MDEIMKNRTNEAQAVKQFLRDHLDKEKDEKHIFDLASGGFSSTVRLAKSNPDMWVPILSQNRENILRVMDTYIEKMSEFRKAVDEGDQDRLRELINEANKIRRIIR